MNGLRSAMRRHAGRRELGEQVTVRNYEFGDEGRAGDDDHGDSDSGRVERAESPHERVPARVRTLERADTERTSAATTPSTDLLVYLPDDHPAVENLAGGPDDAPRSRIERERGAPLAVRMVVPQGNGLVEVSAEVLA